MRRYNFAIPLVIVIILLVFTLTRDRGESVPEHYDSRLMMDTFIEITLWGEGSVSGEAGLDSAFAAIAGVGDLLGDGLITAAESGVLCTPEADSIMARSLTAWRRTEGLFDPTIGAVSRLWEFYPDAEPPDPDSVRAALEYVGLDAYLAAGRSAGESRVGYVLDVGGVAKGYALELAAATVERLGFPAALLNAGGDIKIIGEKPGGGPWRIAVRHPRRRDVFLGCLEVGPVSVATSGDYERSFTWEGKRYHHILDPRDGMPSSGSVSVTVIGRDAGLCDALATGFFVMGWDEALALAEALPGIEAVFVFGEDLDVVTTGGIADMFERME
jgi:thiamine biosynthesis lipoprotein